MLQRGIYEQVINRERRSELSTISVAGHFATPLDFT